MTRTAVIALYLESFGNPRRFSRIARRVSRTKPIVAVKAGRSAAGRRAAGSHTGALVAASDATVDALFAQAGVIRSESYRELLDVAALLACGPPPAGRRLGVVTNGGGPAILLADAAEAAGLELPAFGDAMPNPRDVLGDATADRLRAAVTAAADDPRSTRWRSSTCRRSCSAPTRRRARSSPDSPRPGAGCRSRRCS